MLFRAVLFLLPVATWGALSGGYNYDRCNMTYGPDSWPGACDNQQSGTPINLCGAIPFHSAAPTIALTNYGTSRTMNINNDGTTLKVSVTDSAPPTLQAGSLANIVGQSPSDSSTQTWILEQMHLHWGRYNKTNEGSEHFIQGQAYAAEAHFVHYNSRFASFTAAATSGASDALLVAGVFLKYGTTDDSATITAIAQNAATATVAGAAMTTAVTLTDLFDGTGNFYSYGGSLTTPGCNQVVTWIVMATPKSVSWSTLMMIWKAPLYPSASGMKFAIQATSDYISALGNYRPLQMLNNRTVYNSAGATAACTVVAQPDFMCSAGLTSVSAATSYIASKYAQTGFTFLGVSSMSDADRATLAAAITVNEIIQVTGAVFAYVLCTGTLSLPLVPSTQSEVTAVTVTSWGTTSTRAVFMSYASNSTGLTSMNVPYDSTFAYLFVTSFDRMSDKGISTDTEPMSFQVTGTGITAGLQVMTYSSTSPGGVDITTEGGSVTNEGSGSWLITVTHTSALVGRVKTTTSGQSPSPGTSVISVFKPSVYEHQGLWGLLALLVLPFLAVVVCFWGWKQVKKAPKKVDSVEPMYAVPAPLDTYPFGLPVSPMEYKPALSVLSYPEAAPLVSPAPAFPLMP